MKKKFYVTTAIPYVNAKPHIGFALELVQADVLARYSRLENNDVYFLTGSDENSLKNVQAAVKEGVKTKKLVDKYAEDFKNLKQTLNLSFDDFIRTSEKRHFIGAQKLWSSCNKEDVYKKKYKGLYCVGCESYYTKKDLIDGKCPEHKTVPEEIEEENYFFRLSNYQKKLIEIIQSDKLKIVPVSRKNEVLSFIKSGLEDFSISRSKERAKNWGVPVPGDDSQVMYVWFDALSNYITGLNYGGDEKLYKKYWPADVQVIGKGILRFHAVYWPAMLLSAGIELPQELFIHGYVSINGEKISKSLGNVIEPEEVVKKYGADALRYYLLHEITYSNDGDFSWKKMEEIYNSALANELGNLVTRVIVMLKKYQNDKSENYSKIEENEKLKLNTDIIQNKIAEFQFGGALDEIWRVVKNANEYIESNKPWELAKDKNKLNELENILGNLFKSINGIGQALKPFLPETSQKIKTQIKSLNPEPLFPKK